MNTRTRRVGRGGAAPPQPPPSSFLASVTQHQEPLAASQTFFIPQAMLGGAGGVGMMGLHGPLDGPSQSFGVQPMPLQPTPQPDAFMSYVRGIQGGPVWMGYPPQPQQPFFGGQAPPYPPPMHMQPPPPPQAASVQDQSSSPSSFYTGMSEITPQAGTPTNLSNDKRRGRANHVKGLAEVLLGEGKITSTDRSDPFKVLTQGMKIAVEDFEATLRGYALKSKRRRLPDKIKIRDHIQTLGEPSAGQYWWEEFHDGGVRYYRPTKDAFTVSPWASGVLHHFYTKYGDTDTTRSMVPKVSESPFEGCDEPIAYLVKTEQHPDGQLCFFKGFMGKGEGLKLIYRGMPGNGLIMLTAKLNKNGIGSEKVTDNGEVAKVLGDPEPVLGLAPLRGLPAEYEASEVYDALWEACMRKMDHTSTQSMHEDELHHHLRGWLCDAEQERDAVKYFFSPVDETVNRADYVKFMKWIHAFADAPVVAKALLLDLRDHTFLSLKYNPGVGDVGDFVARVSDTTPRCISVDVFSGRCAKETWESFRCKVQIGQRRSALRWTIARLNDLKCDGFDQVLQAIRQDRRLAQLQPFNNSTQRSKHYKEQSGPGHADEPMSPQGSDDLHLDGSTYGGGSAYQSSPGLVDNLRTADDEGVSHGYATPDGGSCGTVCQSPNASAGGGASVAASRADMPVVPSAAPELSSVNAGEGETGSLNSEDWSPEGLGPEDLEGFRSLGDWLGS